MENFDSYLEIASIIFMLITAVAALTPTKKDDNVVERVQNLLDIVRRKK